MSRPASPGSGEDQLLTRLRDRLESSYRASPLECTSVALASLAYVAKSYRRSRVFLPDHIDCSTLVSQAHWEGAAVQTPFLAETQRTARSATTVAHLRDALPGDVLVAYESLETAPGGRHNHVAMVLTNDVPGDGWAIQATEESGTTIIPLGEALIGGGIRRFCPNPLAPYPDKGWEGVARRIPKLGRLGVRLTNPERRHRGVDVQVEHGTAMYAPIGGLIAIEDSTVVIRDEDSRMMSTLRPIRVAPHLTDGGTVARGDLLGTSSGMAPGSSCDSTVFAGARPHVHWEFWAASPMGYHPSVTVEAPGHLAYNPVYAVKQGAIGSPLGVTPAGEERRRPTDRRIAPGHRPGGTN